MNHSFDLLIDSFLDCNVGIDYNFISKSLSQGLQQNIRQLLQHNLMVSAGIGNSEIKDAHQKVRGDRIYWMDKSHDNAFEQAFLRQVEDFIVYLNRTCYAGINGYEFHYAVYEEGSYYKRHRDQFKTDNHRKFSLIIYLNDDWVEGNGGELLVYQNDNTKTITPLAQTAVFFRSDEMEHEVSLAHKTRMSITGWLKS